MDGLRFLMHPVPVGKGGPYCCRKSDAECLHTISEVWEPLGCHSSLSSVRPVRSNGSAQPHPQHSKAGEPGWSSSETCTHLWRRFFLEPIKNNKEKEQCIKLETVNCLLFFRLYLSSTSTSVWPCMVWHESWQHGAEVQPRLAALYSIVLPCNYWFTAVEMIDCFTGGREGDNKIKNTRRYLKQWMCSTYWLVTIKWTMIKVTLKNAWCCHLLCFLHLEGSQGEEKRKKRTWRKKRKSERRWGLHGQGKKYKRRYNSYHFVKRHFKHM